VAAGTVSSTSTSTLPRAGTVTVDFFGLAVCGEPELRATATRNVAGLFPKFRRLTTFRPLKVPPSSAKPKFSVAVPPMPRATTCVATAPGAWIRPLPEIRAEYPLT
jgi:hypothetical protein